jgi:hypothetical protein
MFARTLKQHQIGRMSATVGGLFSRLLVSTSDTSGEPLELRMPELPLSEANKTVNVLIAWMLRVKPAERPAVKGLLE